VQRRALDIAAGALWASNYAMNTAISEYGADPSRQTVTRFGLNLPNNIERRDLESILAAKDNQTIRLMFIGFNYKQKGARASQQDRLATVKRVSGGSKNITFFDSSDSSRCVFNAGYRSNGRWLHPNYN
jgi:hypothetical protein